jgi:electron transfer flavoprotein alpha subunit
VNVMTILVIAEHDNNELKPVTLNTLSAAQAIGGDIHLLVAGSGCQSVVDAAAQIPAVTQVLVADNAAYEHQLAENVSKLVQGLAASYSHILGSSTTTAKNLLPRVAALLDVNQISDVMAIESADTFKRPIYAGNAIATVQSGDAIKVMTVRGTAFDPVEGAGGSAEVVSLSEVCDAGSSRFINEEIAVSERPELTAASIVVSGGRGMGNGENFELLNKVADKLGAAVGASRAAVDSALGGHERFKNYCRD